MEGATLGGKLAAEVICDRAAGREYQAYQSRAINPDIAGKTYEPKKPLGVMGPCLPSHCRACLPPLTYQHVISLVYMPWGHL